MGNRRSHKKTQRRDPKGWDELADWYNGWVGKGGSKYHRRLAIPTVMKLLAPQPNEQILDVGAGQGVLAPFIHEAGAKYTGADVSERLLNFARSNHKGKGRFVKCDAAKLHQSGKMQVGSFDAAVFLLSIQDMNPLNQILSSAEKMLKPNARIVLLMTHPAFRIPRQSGWGFDEGRKLQYRRIDRYLTPLTVPMKPYAGGKSGANISFHRPIHHYVNGLAELGFNISRMEEVPVGSQALKQKRSAAEKSADNEIPVFLGLRATRL